MLNSLHTFFQLGEEIGRLVNSVCIFTRRVNALSYMEPRQLWQWILMPFVSYSFVS